MQGSQYPAATFDDDLSSCGLITRIWCCTSKTTGLCQPRWRPSKLSCVFQIARQTDPRSQAFLQSCRHECKKAQVNNGVLNVLGVGSPDSSLSSGLDVELKRLCKNGSQNGFGAASSAVSACRLRPQLSELVRFITEGWSTCFQIPLQQFTARRLTLKFKLPDLSCFTIHVVGKSQVSFV